MNKIKDLLKSQLNIDVVCDPWLNTPRIQTDHKTWLSIDFKNIYDARTVIAFFDEYLRGYIKSECYKLSDNSILVKVYLDFSKFKYKNQSNLRH